MITKISSQNQKKKPLKQGIIIVCVELESVKVEEHN